MQSPRICNPLAQRAYESDAKSPSGTCFYRTYGRRRDRHLRSLKLLACGGLSAFACASRADLPSAPDGKAWVPIPDRSSELMAYAASELRKTARAHGMKCGGVVSASRRPSAAKLISDSAVVSLPGPQMIDMTFWSTSGSASRTTESKATPLCSRCCMTMVGVYASENASGSWVRAVRRGLSIGEALRYAQGVSCSF
jgi:hypothetical protein